MDVASTVEKLSQSKECLFGGKLVSRDMTLIVICKRLPESG